MKIDSRSHRLLVQSRDFHTEVAFRTWIATTFGTVKAQRCVILPGFAKPGPAMMVLANERVNNPIGFRAFLPL